MAIDISLENNAAIYIVSAIESQIEKLIKYCKNNDEEFGNMNNIHRDIARNLLNARDEMIIALKKQGYAMSRIVVFDTTEPGWQNIP